MQIISPAFREGAAIPVQYTCKGQNVSPPLNIVDAPKDAKSLALIVHDPDAVSSDFVHWLVWDIPADNGNIAANKVPVGAVQGLNGAQQTKYMGPCPPAGTGTHHYMFELYALDKSLGLPAQTNHEQLKQAMEGSILAQNTLTGLVSAE